MTYSPFSPLISLASSGADRTVASRSALGRTQGEASPPEHCRFDLVPGARRLLPGEGWSEKVVARIPVDLAARAHTARRHISAEAISAGERAFWVPVAGLFAMLPSALLHLPANKIERRGPRTFSSVDGTGALLQGLLGQLIVRADQFQALEAARLGITVIDLLTIMLAHEHNLSAPPETRQRTLITQIHAFIHQRLSDPTLSPETIAAAHNISLRSLQRLFHAQGHAVAAWIRERRLDHCRRDLTDSRISHRPIHAIAARWGFTDAAHFTHTFRAAYGVTPQDYRRQHLIEHT